ncbi:MAG: DUF1361 domain-containing protein [Cyanobacteria bacterium RI_101]|nr:DUF1361 domain-containing protein [Cyanobacteria bacterium RI_101]
MDLLQDWLRLSWDAMRVNERLMVWNTFLALIPLVLSVWLFRRSRRRSPGWWLLLAVFIAFLPNAPYILTDIIHYVKIMRRPLPESVLIFAVTPQFFLYLLAGFQCYVLSLINLGAYLRDLGLTAWILPAELLAHFLSAVGIYLGRFLRWNSWDLATRPEEVGRSLARSLSHERPLLAMGVTFLILAALYWPAKQMDLGLALRWRQRSRAPQWLPLGR